MGHLAAQASGYYTCDMAKEAPVSIRIATDVKPQLAAHLAATNSNMNAAINRLLRLGLQSYEDTPKFEVREGPGTEPSQSTIGPHLRERVLQGRQALAQAEAKAAHLAKPKPRKRWNVGGQS